MYLDILGAIGAVASIIALILILIEPIKQRRWHIVLLGFVCVIFASASTYLLKERRDWEDMRAEALRIVGDRDMIYGMTAGGKCGRFFAVLAFANKYNQQLPTLAKNLDERSTVCKQQPPRDGSSEYLEYDHAVTLAAESTLDSLRGVMISASR
jgi:hypothetical protein